MATTALASAAQAQEFTFNPYVGLEISRLSVNYQTFNAAPGVSVDGDEIFADSFNVINPVVGADLNKHLAVELGYLQTSAESESLSAVDRTKLKMKGFHVDVLGKYPVSDKFELLGSVGVARLEADINAILPTAGAQISGDEKDTAWRLGVGAKFNLTQNWALRGMVRYMSVDFDDSVDDLIQYGVGVVYRF